jgi:ribosomal protein S18 acetylase RimI-like enzyme
MDFRVSVSTDVPRPDDEDAETLAFAEQLAGLCRGKFDTQKIRDYFDMTTHILLLAKMVNKRPLLAGFLMLYCPSIGDAKIQLVCVAGSQKGLGLSTRLIDKAKEIAKTAGKTELQLERESDEPSLVNVYTSQGFKDVEGMRGTMTIQLGGSRLHAQRRRTSRKRLSTRRRTLSRRR